MRWTTAVALLAIWSTAATAAQVTFSGATNQTITLQSGAHANWFIVNTGGTDTGNPSGTCSSNFAGLAVHDATLEPGGVNKGDALDNGFTVWVNDAQFVSPDTVDVANETLTAGPANLSGLDVTVEYKALQSSPTLRARVALHNPSSAPIDVSFRFATNFGSDAKTGTRASSTSGNWMVTSDDPTAPSDPVLLMVSRGATIPATGVPLGATSLTTFACATTDGSELDATSLVVPPGETLYVMEFLELAATVADAITAGAVFDVTPPSDPEMTADLTDAIWYGTINWNFFGERDVIGGDGKWVVTGFVAASNRQASGGKCVGAPGIGITDGRIMNSPFEDAFNDGQVLFVDGHQLTPPITEEDTAGSVTFGPQTLSGLDVTLSYTAFEGNLLRTFVTLHNPTTASVSTTVQMASNFGSDAKTTVLASSNGDTTIDSGDVWVVTADDPATPSDAINTSIVAGPGPLLPVAPELSATVFDCSGTQGLSSTFALTLGPGESQALLFFNFLNGTVADALNQTSGLDQIPAPDDPVLSDIDTARLARVVNWALCRESTYPQANCRLDGMSADLTDTGTAGQPLSKLLARLAAAKTALGKAEKAARAGKQRAVPSRIKAASGALKTFEKQLKSKKVKAVLGDDARARLDDTSIDVRTQLKGLPRRIVD